MSIQSELDRIKRSVADAYEAVGEVSNQLSDTYDVIEESGGDIPNDLTIANLPNAIRSIPSGLAGSTTAVTSGKNILDNWDFRNPVNRNGATFYTGAGFCIDRWWLRNDGTAAAIELELTDLGVRIHRGASGTSLSAFNQHIWNPERLLGRQVTYSVLVSENNSDSQLKLSIFRAASTNTNSQNVGELVIPAGGTGLFTKTATVFDDFGTYSQLNFGFLRSGADANQTLDITIQAVKLEIGDKQTLAKKDDNGEWKIIEESSYEEQYGICSLRSPTTDEWIGGEALGYSVTDNLLDNWYFGNPVNRLGCSVYTNPALGNKSMTIDRWYLNHYPGEMLVKGNCIEIHTTGSNIMFRQVVMSVDECRKLCIGKKLTVSMLTDDGRLLTATTNVITEDALPTTDGQLVLLSSKNIDKSYLRLIFEYKYLNIDIYVDHNQDTIGIIAVKLEIGDHQTLAKPTENGIWELLEIPNYETQYLRCSLYSLELQNLSSPYKNFVGIPSFRNQNQLINWYFPDPVNQRGKTNYTENGYTIDRFKLTTAGVLSLALESDCISLSLSEGTTGWPSITYIFENPENYAGKLMTFSALIKNPDGLSYIFTAKNTNGSGVGFTSDVVNSEGTIQSEYTLITITGMVPENSTQLRVILYIGNQSTVTGTLYIKAMKAELGSVQTLAHREGDAWVLNDPPPDKALELVKCQKYYRRFTSDVDYSEFVGVMGNTSTCYSSYRFERPMYKTPSFLTSDTLPVIYTVGGGNLAVSSITAGSLSKTGCTLTLTGTFSQATTCIGALVKWPKNSWFAFDAEL